VDAAWELFDRWSDPFGDGEDPHGAARLRRDFGLEGEPWRGACAPVEAWSEFERFLERGGPATVLTADAEIFRAWEDHHRAHPGLRHRVLGLSDVALLLVPGRLAGAREQLLSELCAGERELAAPAAWTPRDLRRAFAKLAARFAAHDSGSLRLAVSSLLAAWRGLCESEPAAAQQLSLVLSIVDQPSAWTEPAKDARARPRDGLLSSCLSPRELLEPGELARELVEILRPRCAQFAEPLLEQPTVPPRSDDDKPFSDADRELVDEVFEVHLPALFAEAGGAGDPRAGAGSYRIGQHQVARSVAQTLGERELLLVHAPTGTGKTLAYLIPALIWSARHNVRVGISTYTRALQEQAMEREVPRALRALLRARAVGSASLPVEPRAALLKGRNNYVCWRALKAHTPAAEDGPEQWLAWTQLALFALSDETGDLDRFPQRLALAGEAGAGGPRGPSGHGGHGGHGGHAGQRELESLTRQVRAYVACCSAREDRETCGAEIARARAERSHVVVTNHSFLLARQSYFRHVIFDECEHLHEQAHSAWSHTLGLGEIRETLARVHQPRSPTARSPLDRLARVVFEGSSAHGLVEESKRAWLAANAGLRSLEVAVDGFLAWREEKRRTRDPRDEHSLLREFVLHHDSQALLDARNRLCAGIGELAAGLAGLAELLDTLALRGRSRIRRALEISRGELDGLDACLQAWLPLQEGEPAFRPETFYDVEEDARGKVVLAARVLLPNEYLGRNFYPQLENAVLISATTWLRGGFESSRGYLGLDRAEHPDETEEREPSSVRTFRAPDPFDYSRVLVCVPRDAPAYGDDRGAFQAYVRRFVAHLGERTRGRMLVLFTNADEARRNGEELAGFFRARRIPFWFQNMPGLAKEELGALFRSRVDSILLGLDTFWFGADFPGETLEYLVIVKLPYGVPDRYHHAQCAALGLAEQRRRIYLPRALGKFRQGFGRLMRRETDRGCVFVLDARSVEGRHRQFLAELPLRGPPGELDRDPDWDNGGEVEWTVQGSRLLVADTQECVRAALEHMELTAEVARRGLDAAFEEGAVIRAPTAPPRRGRRRPAGRVSERRRDDDPARLDIAPGDAPF
jgi:ATP-dependent DNA helicase DinG